MKLRELLQNRAPIGNSFLSKTTNLPKKTKIIVLIVLILIIASMTAACYLILNPANDKRKDEGKAIPRSPSVAQEQDILFRGEPTAVYKMGEKARLGALEIDFYNFRESSYSSLDLDKDYVRIHKRYLATHVKVFNLSHEKTEIILIGLMDDRGNRYLPDYSASAYIPNLREFGRNTNIYPRIFQDGYIFFTNVNERANKLKLIFAVLQSKEKIAFEFERVQPQTMITPLITAPGETPISP